ncbi:MAG TPA: tetratricopeptide repeat protein [Candidatus Binatia bacterium]|nr:tetratricopeptide repeat protein [Candidatus Binatia bacterium]
MSDTAADLVARAARAKREHRLADARRDVMRAIDVLRQQHNAIELAGALRLLAEVERKSGDGPSARRHYEEAVGLCRQHGDSLVLAHTVRHLGDVHQQAGRADLAEPCYEEALNLYRARSDAAPLDLANVIRSMAVLKDNTGDIAEVKVLWQQARDLYTQVNVADGVAESSARLARLADRQS